MKTGFYSYSSTSSYSNINGKENFEKIEVENNNGKKRVKKTFSKNGKLISKVSKLLGKK